MKAKKTYTISTALHESMNHDDEAITDHQSSDHLSASLHSTLLELPPEIFHGICSCSYAGTDELRLPQVPHPGHTNRTIPRNAVPGIVKSSPVAGTVVLNRIADATAPVVDATAYADLSQTGAVAAEIRAR